MLHNHGLSPAKDLVRGCQVASVPPQGYCVARGIFIGRRDGTKAPLFAISAGVKTSLRNLRVELTCTRGVRRARFSSPHLTTNNTLRSGQFAGPRQTATGGGIHRLEHIGDVKPIVFSGERVSLDRKTVVRRTSRPSGDDFQHRSFSLRQLSFQLGHFAGII